VGARIDAFSYDAGQNQSFFMLQVSADRAIAPHLLLGVIGSWAHVGDVPRPWVQVGSNERVLPGGSHDRVRDASPVFGHSGLRVQAQPRSGACSLFFFKFYRLREPMGSPGIPYVV
jgi:hypothetical protein